MGIEDDIAASLPPPPLPAPARREAAIEEALRRFDGGGARPRAAAGGRRETQPARWRPRLNRPYAGALVSAALVALIALPIAWTSLNEQPIINGGAPQTDRAREAARPDTAFVTADKERPPSGKAPPTTIASNDAAPPPAARAETEAETAPPALADLAQTPSPPPPAPPPPAPPPPAAELAQKSEAAPAAPARPDRAMAAARTAAQGVPTTLVREERDDSNIVVTGTRVASPRANRRGDWNACTVNDPSRSLRNCRHLVDPAAKGTAGRAAARVADGLARAWAGDVDEAIAAFGQAIEIAPNSSFAYLNRGLAHRRNGDLDRALADLDRAIRYAPRSARAYYHRSIVLRQRGDARRARADEQRAVDLDPRYADLVR